MCQHFDLHTIAIAKLHTLTIFGPRRRAFQGYAGVIDAARGDFAAIDPIRDVFRRTSLPLLLKGLIDLLGR
jgi:hypothetical protein